MRLRKRVLAATLSAAMVFSLVPANIGGIVTTVDAAAVEGLAEQDVKWNEVPIGTEGYYDYILRYVDHSGMQVDPVQGVQYEVVQKANQTVTDNGIVSGNQTPVDPSEGIYSVEWSLDGTPIVTDGNTLTYEDVLRSKSDQELIEPGVDANGTYKLSISMDSINKDVDIPVEWAKVAKSADNGKKKVYLSKDWDDDQTSDWFECPDIEGDGVDPTYQWYHKEYGEWSFKGTGYEQDVYYREDGNDDSGEWCCVIRVEKDGKLAQVIVEKGFSVKILDQMPVRRVSRLNERTVCKGQSLIVAPEVTLAADVSAYDIKYSWTKKSDGTSVSSENTLKFDTVKDEDFGSYTFAVTVNDKEDQTEVQKVTRSFRLQERGPYLVNQKDRWGDPELTEDEKGYQYRKWEYVTIGGKLYLDVDLKPEDGWTLSYEWFVNGHKQAATGRSYEISNVGTNDLGTYSCKVTATKGTDTYAKDTFIFNVKENKGVHRVTQTDTEYESYVPEGMAFSLKASEYEAGQGYTLSFQWQKYDPTKEDEWGDNGVYVDIPNETRQSLDLSPIKSSDYGSYRYLVTAKRADGTGSVTTTSEEFRITESPKLQMYRKSDRMVTKNVGDEISLQVAGTVGSDKYDITYVWEKDETPIAGETTAILKKTLTRDDFGTYTCTANAVRKDDPANVLASKSYSFVVIQDTGFEVQTPLKNVIYGKKIGDKVTLSVVAATGNEKVYPLTYKWEKYDDYVSLDNPQVIEGAVAKDLAVELKHDSDLTRYICTVSNGEDSRQVEFRIVKDNGFYARPNGQDEFYKKVGDSVEFVVKAGVENDPSAVLTYKWYQNGDEIVDVNGPVYKIPSLKKGHFTSFRCEVTDQSTKLTKSVYFYVEDAADQFSFIEKNEDITYDRKIKVKEGGTATLGVTPVNPDGVNLIYRWYFEAGVYSYGWDHDDGFEEDRCRLLDNDRPDLGLTNITKEQFGAYSLLIYKNDLNDRPVQTKRYFVQKEDHRVYAKRKNDAESTFRRKLGDSVAFEVEAETDLKDGKLSYQWYKGEEPSEAIYGETNAVLTLTGIKEADYGQYYCEVSVGDVSASVRFNLVEATGLKVEWDIVDGFGEKGTKYVEADLGKKVGFEIKATADPAYTVAYQWGKYIDIGEVSKRESIYNATGSSYTIDAVTKDAYGAYYCEVTDGVVSETYYFQLVANDGLKLSNGHRTTVEIQKGENAKFNVSATCAKGFNLSYQWYRAESETGYEKIAGAVQASYTTGAINFGPFDPLKYMCKVTTDAGTTEKTAYFEIVERGRFNVEVDADKDGAVVGSTVVYTAKVSDPGKRKLTYQWYKQNDRRYDDSYEKIKGATSLTYTAKMPAIKDVFDYQDYMCVISSGTNEYDKEIAGSVRTLVVQKPSKMDKLPASITKDDTNIQGYSAPKASALTVTFDASRKLAKGTSLTVIDGNGIVDVFAGRDKGLDLSKATLSLKGGSAYFLFQVDSPDTTEDMSKTGYKVKAVKATTASTPRPTVTTTTKKLTLGVKEKCSVAVKGAKYSTDKKAVAAVTAKGVITAKKTGSAKITVKTSKQTIIYNVTVKKAPKKIQKVTPAKKTLKVKKSFTIKVTLPKGTASNKITFTSSNKKVATVNSKGKVTAKKKGTANITVKTFNGKKKVIKVTVKK